VENNANQDSVNSEMEQPVSTELVGTGGPKPPKGISEAEAQRIRQQAEAMIKQLSEVSGSKEFEILDNMANMESKPNETPRDTWTCLKQE